MLTYKGGKKHPKLGSKKMKEMEKQNKKKKKKVDGTELGILSDKLQAEKEERKM